MVKNTKLLPKDITLKRVLPVILLFAAFVGLIASFALTYDKIQVLKNPGYDPSCNLNPILSCGSVMKTEQASLLGIPNTIYGIAAFSALATFSFMLLAGAKVKKWLWLFVQAFATLGVIFMHYLFFQGVYRINAICPWCFVTWMVVIPVFWYVTVYNIQENNLKLAGIFSGTRKFILRNHLGILILWYLAIFGILLTHFWYYWSTLV